MRHFKQSQRDKMAQIAAYRSLMMNTQVLDEEDLDTLHMFDDRALARFVGRCPQDDDPDTAALLRSLERWGDRRVA